MSIKTHTLTKPACALLILGLSSFGVASETNVMDQVTKAVITIAQLPESEIKPIYETQETLKALPSRPALEALCQFLSDNNPRKRRAAVHIIGHLDWEDSSIAYEPLRALLSHPEDITRGMAVMTLASIGDRESYQAMLTMLDNDDSAYARRCAAWALGELADVKALDALRNAKGDADANVRNNALNAVERLEFIRRFPSAGPGEAVVPINAIFLLAGATPTDLQRLKKARDLCLAEDINQSFRTILCARILGTDKQLPKSYDSYVEVSTGAGASSWRHQNMTLALTEESTARSIRYAAILLAVLTNDDTPIPESEREMCKKLKALNAQARDIWGELPIVTKPKSTPKHTKKVTPDDKASLVAKALQSHVSIEFEGEHISNILSFISDYVGINIVLDYRKVAQQGVELQEGQVTDGIVPHISVKDVELGDALDALLRPLNLSYKAQEGFIWVSTAEALRSESFSPPETRTYELKSSTNRE